MKTALMRMVLGVLLMSAWLCMGGAAPAYANVTINPTLLVIEGRARYADMLLINTSNKPTTYNLGWRLFRMEDGTGSYKEVEKPLTDFDLREHLIFTPKRITLAPKSSQRIRFALRLKDGPPPPGDYTAHFSLTEATVQDNGDETQDGRTSLGVKIHVGFTVPVVYRVGDAKIGAKIGDITVQANQQSGRLEMQVPVTKTSQGYGILGTLDVYYRPEGGKEEKISGLSNANMFAEASNRTFKVVLSTPSLKAGTLRVVLKDQDKSKNTVYDERIVPIR